ncbi:MAG: DUF4397 domain-containing protein [Rhizobacter sp.]|nr:DUF4397 domain-containing protein [Rhizobacter sp.]
MKFIHKLLLAAAPMLLVAACGGGDDSLDDRLDIADPKLRFVHAIPAGPSVDLYRNTEIVGGVQNVPYKYASNYFVVDTNGADYTVRTNIGGLQVGTIHFNPDRGDKYTLVAVPGDATTPNLLFIQDPYDKSVTSHDGRVRVVNASYNAANIDVYLTPVATDITTVSPSFPGAAFRAAVPASGSNSVDYAPGDYTLRVTTSGTKNVIFSAPLTVGQDADLLLLTLPNGLLTNEVKVLAVTSDSAQPAIEIFSSP